MRYTETDPVFYDDFKLRVAQNSPDLQNSGGVAIATYAEYVRIGGLLPAPSPLPPVFSFAF